MKHLRRGERGQAIAEFALVGIAFFLLIFGMIDVGRAVWNYNTLSQATREGTRYAIVHGAFSSDPSGPSDDSDIVATVQQHASGMDASQLTVTTTWPDGNNEVGSDITVTSQYTYEPIFNFFGIVSFTMTSSSTMEITN